MAEMITYIAGVPHRPGARERLANLVPGEQLRLTREPNNPYDKNAVAIYDGDLHLGYVPAVDAPAVSKALAQDLEVVALYTGATVSTQVTITWES